MELRQMEYLVAVVEESNFTRAAERLHVAQPGVSAQIRRLERELGHTLLDRSTRVVRPTEAGRAVVSHARDALAAVSRVRTSLDDIDGLLRGRVTVGSVATAGPLRLPDSLADFHQLHPGLDITLTEDASYSLVERLMIGSLDVAVIGVGGALPAGLASTTITERALVALVPPDHAFAAHPSVSLEEIGDQSLITMPRGTGIRDALDAGFLTAGLSPRIEFEAGDPAVVVRLAERGLGVAVLPAGEGENKPSSTLTEIAITNPRMRARLVLAWRDQPQLGAAAAKLVDYLRTDASR